MDGDNRRLLWDKYCFDGYGSSRLIRGLDFEEGAFIGENSLNIYFQLVKLKYSIAG
jgi:hypothetical protein